jgi:hypothetical protein
VRPSIAEQRPHHDEKRPKREQAEDHSRAKHLVSPRTQLNMERMLWAWSDAAAIRPS